MNITCALLLDQAESYLNSSRSWAYREDFGRGNDHMQRALALLEAVEVVHCGSVGGFGKIGNKDQRFYPKYQTVDGRIKWLRKIY